MQDLKMRLGLLLGIFLFSSCGSLPSEPEIEICTHDEPLAEVECYNNQTEVFRTISINDTDKYIMFSADDYGELLLYIKKLQKKSKNKKVKTELNKFIKASNKQIKKAKKK